MHFLNEQGFYRPPGIEMEFDAIFPWHIHRPILGRKRHDIYPTVYYRCPICDRCEMQLIECGLWD